MSAQGQHRAEATPVVTPADEEPTIGKLVADASRDISALLHGEIALLKAELKVSVANGGIGAALLAAAGFLCLLVTVMVSFAFAYFLVMAGLHPAWAFLIVTGAYLLLAVLLAMIGVRKLKQVRPPEKTIETAQKIPQALKGQA